MLTWGALDGDADDGKHGRARFNVAPPFLPSGKKMKQCRRRSGRFPPARFSASTSLLSSSHFPSSSSKALLTSSYLLVQHMLKLPSSSSTSIFPLPSLFFSLFPLFSPSGQWQELRLVVLAYMRVELRGLGALL